MVKNFALDILAGSMIAARTPNRQVAIPSRIKIQRQPAKFPTPSILMIAVARRPVYTASSSTALAVPFKSVPPKAPDKDARQ